MNGTMYIPLAIIVYSTLFVRNQQTVIRISKQQLQKNYKHNINQDDVYVTVIVAKPLQDFTKFI